MKIVNIIRELDNWIVEYDNGIKCFNEINIEDEKNIINEFIEAFGNGEEIENFEEAYRKFIQQTHHTIESQYQYIKRHLKDLRNIRNAEKRAVKLQEQLYRKDKFDKLKIMLNGKSPLEYLKEEWAEKTTRKRRRKKKDKKN